MNGSRPRPVLIYGVLVAALEALLGAADLADLLPERVIDWLRLVLVVLVAAGGALWAQSKVTPLSSPRNAEGMRLVPYVHAGTPSSGYDLPR